MKRNTLKNSNYKRGAKFERDVLNKLIDQGYSGMRSAGSHSCADLFIWKDQWHNEFNNPPIDKPKLFMVQCKTSQQSDVNLTELIWQDSVRELTSLPECFTKVLLIKTHRKITQLIWLYTGDKQYEWSMLDVFDLK